MAQTNALHHATLEAHSLLAIRREAWRIVRVLEGIAPRAPPALFDLNASDDEEEDEISFANQGGNAAATPEAGRDGKRAEDDEELDRIVAMLIDSKHVAPADGEGCARTSQSWAFDKVVLKLGGAFHAQQRRFVKPFHVPRTTCGMSGCSLPRFHKGHCNSMTFTIRKRPRQGFFRLNRSKKPARDWVAVEGAQAMLSLAQASA